MPSNGMQRQLFETGELYDSLPPHSDNDTSRGAAEAIAPHVSRLAEEVLEQIWLCGEEGSTCDEIEFLKDMKHQTVSARIRELKIKGRIKDSGLRRKTRSDRPAIVWVVT